MNEAQETKIKDLVRRYKTDMESADIMLGDPETKMGIAGLPYGWVLVNVKTKEGKFIIQAGVSPEGHMHT
tara:strand:+ start:527 stop:736 length:210 start_codon:yes stop_codon:yes gene_type:complete